MPLRRRDGKGANDRSSDDVRAALARARRAVTQSRPITRTDRVSPPPPAIKRTPVISSGPITRPSAAYTSPTAATTAGPGAGARFPPRPATTQGVASLGGAFTDVRQLQRASTGTSDRSPVGDNSRLSGRPSPGSPTSLSSSVAVGDGAAETAVRTYTSSASLPPQLNLAFPTMLRPSSSSASPPPPPPGRTSPLSFANAYTPAALHYSSGVGGGGPIEAPPRGETGAAFVEAASVRHRPLLPDTIRDAVHMYLESTGRHDVVSAMLRAEKSAAAATFASPPTPQTATATTPAPPFPPPPQQQQQQQAGQLPVQPRRPTPTSSSTFAQASPTLDTTSTPAVQSSKSPPPQHSLHAEARRRKTAAKKSHELLKRGLLERSVAKHARNPTDVVRGAAAGGLLSSYVLPTLYGLEESVQPDIVLLYTAAEEKLLLQYAQLGLPPPPKVVLRYLVVQINQPMWSAADVADATFLPSPDNLATGNVLYGTVNQLVEELTRVYIFPTASTPERLVIAGQQFQEAFFRQYRLFVPSSVLLAKLIERFLVPLSLKYHPDHFHAHGITIHAPGNGSSLSLARSQGETVYRSGGGAGGGGGGRQHTGPGATPTPPAPGGEQQSSPQSPGNPMGTQGSPWRGDVGGGASRNQYEPVGETGVGGAQGSETDRGALRRGLGGGVTWPSVMDGLADASPSTSFHDRFMGGVAGGPTVSAASGSPQPPTHPHPQQQQQQQQPDVQVKLITHYSKSGTLWLQICEKVQTKVLTVILQWLTVHPSHFDEDTIHSLLHFVEVCCYAPSRFADCPSRFPQVAEFIRMNCYAILQKIKEKRKRTTEGHADPAASASAAADVTYDGALGRPRDLRAATLCRHALDERRKAVEDAIPPTLRRSHPTMATWRSLVEAKELRYTLPVLALRKRLGTVDLAGIGSTILSSLQHTGGRGLRPRAGSLMPSPTAGGGRGATATEETAATLEKAEKALELFSNFTLEEYVRGLTAAHQALFSKFPAPDLLVAALHATASFQTSATFQQSYLGVFLRSATELTQWSASLLLHAAFVDGEKRRAAFQRAATAAAVTTTTPNGSVTQGPQGGSFFNGNASILSSVVGDVRHGMQDFYITSQDDGGSGRDRAAHSETHHLTSNHHHTTSPEEGGEANDDGSHSSIESSHSPVRRREHTGSVHGGFSFASNGGFSDTTTAAAAAALQATVGGMMPTTAEALRRSLSRLPPEMRRYALSSPARHLLTTLNKVVDLVVGFLRVNNLHASYNLFRGLSHPFVKKLLSHPSVAPHIDGHTSQQLRQLTNLFARPEHMARRAKRAADHAGADGTYTGDGHAGGGEENKGTHDTHSNSSHNHPDELADLHAEMTLGEYVKTLSDNAEFPTIPAVSYYLRELQRIHATEPTFLTKMMDEIYPRGDHHSHRDDSVAGAGSSITPVCLVHWRKLRTVDEIIQTVSTLQTSCLYYISSRATVVRFAAVNLELEKAFVEQLSHTIVEDISTQRELATNLLSVL